MGYLPTVGLLSGSNLPKMDGVWTRYIIICSYSKDQYVEDATDTNTKLTITDAKLSSDKYATILVTNAGKTAVTLNGTVDISETKDSAYAVWYDEGSIVDCNNSDSKKR